jgi:hypothetical protein
MDLTNFLEIGKILSTYNCQLLENIPENMNYYGDVETPEATTCHSFLDFLGNYVEQ